MFHMQAYAAEKEQKNCSYPMYKLAKDLKVEPLNCILLSLQHERTLLKAFYKRETPHTDLHSSGDIMCTDY